MTPPLSLPLIRQAARRIYATMLLLPILFRYFAIITLMLPATLCRHIDDYAKLPD